MNPRATLPLLLCTLALFSPLTGCSDDASTPTGGSAGAAQGGQAGSGGSSGGAGTAEGGQAGAAGAAGAAGEGGADAGAGAGGEAGNAGASGDAGAAGAAGAGPVAIEWEKGPSMKVARYEHTATALPDGRVLIVGGQTFSKMLDSTELLSADGASFSEGPALPEPRSNHGVVALQDGRLLIVGGGPTTSNGLPSGKGVLASALLFDPATGQLTGAAPLKTARSHFASARLADGRVLVAGGTAEGGGVAKDAEIYDPASDTWTPIDGPPTATMSSRSATLKDGRILVLGGLSGSISKAASLFDGTAWTKLPPTSLPRYRHSLAPLPSGGALVVAGLTGNGVFSSSTERLDGELSAWTPAPDLSADGDGIEKPGGTGTVALPLPSGRVLVTGSYVPQGLGYGSMRFAAVYDESSDAWTNVSSPIEARSAHAAVRLQDGRVMTIGGLTGSNTLSKSSERSAAPVE